MSARAAVPQPRVADLYKNQLLLPQGAKAGDSARRPWGRTTRRMPTCDHQPRPAPPRPACRSPKRKTPRARRRCDAGAGTYLADEPRCLAQDFAPRRPAGSSSSLECVVRRLLARRQLVRLEHGAQLLWDVVHVRANAEDGANDGARPVAEAYCHHVGVRVLDRASPDDLRVDPGRRTQQTVGGRLVTTRGAQHTHARARARPRVVGRPLHAACGSSPARRGHAKLVPSAAGHMGRAGSRAR